MKKKQKTLIWRFYTEGASAVNYLLGTMHITDNQAFTFEEAMKKRVLECTVFASEFNFDEADISVAQAAMLLPESVVLSQILSKKLYAKTGQLLKKRLHQDIGNYENFKPIIFSKLITETVLSNDRLQSLDDMLFEFARENGRILRGVETFDEQINILHSMSLEGQIKALKDMVGGFSKVRKELLKTAKWYAEADLKQLYNASKASMKGNKRLMIFDRNDLMTQRIAAMAAENTVCVAIGAGHLWGEKGVLNQLKKKGFIVQPN